MRGYRKDANHAQIVKELASCGVWILDLAQYGLSVDLLCGYRGVLCLVEVKTPGKVPKTKPRRDWLTDKELQLCDELQYHQLPYIIGLNSEEILQELIRNADDD